MPAEISCAAGCSARTSSATRRSRANESAGLGPERCHRHHAPQAQTRCAGDGLGQRQHLRHRHAAARGVAVEAHLDEHVELAAGELGTAAEGGDEALAVDGVDDVGPPGQRVRLLGLHLPDRVPHQVEVGAALRLLAALGDPRLPHVADAEVGQQPHVRQRVGLGHHDQGQLGGVAPRGRARGPRSARGRRPARRASSADRSPSVVTALRRRTPVARAARPRPRSVRWCRRAGARTGPAARPCSRAPAPPARLASCSCCSTPAATSIAGVPAADTDAATGTAAATSSRRAAGTS